MQTDTVEFFKHAKKYFDYLFNTSCCRKMHSISISGKLEILSFGREELTEADAEFHDRNEGRPILGKKKTTDYRNTFIFHLSVFAALIGGPIPAGFNISALNTSQGLFEDFIEGSLKSRDQSLNASSIFTWTSSLFCVTAAFGCFFGTYLCDKFGRKRAFYLNVFILLLGSFSALFSKWGNIWEMLLIGRIIVGVNAGATSVIATTYLSEISPKAIRGSVGSLYQFGLIVGHLFSNIPGFSFVLGHPDRIHFIFLIPILMGFAQMVILFFCPESPRYLFIDQNDYPMAKMCLMKLRGPEALDLLAEEVEDMSKENNLLKQESKLELRSFITRPSIRRPLVLACMLAVCNQTTGINAFSFYSTRIFESGISQKMLNDYPDFPRVVASLISMSMIVGTAASMFVIEKVGRKNMLIVALAAIAFCMTLVGFLLTDMSIDDSSACLVTWGHSQVSYFVACAVTLIYSATCSFGPGPLAWLMAPELFTLRARCTGTSIANFTEWISAFLIATTFPYMAHWFCGFSFFVFGLAALLLISFFAKFLPKTDGLSTYEINQIFLKLES